MRRLSVKLVSFICTIALLTGLFPIISFGATQSFFAPAETSGSISVKLYPMENVTSGQTKLVTFGVPFPRGSITPANVSKIRVLKGGTEIPAYVEMQTPWRSITNASLDGASVRVARIQIQNTFTSVYPNSETITVEWGLNNRSQNIATLTNPRSAWHQVTSGTFTASDNVYEPDVYAVLPKDFLAEGVLKGTRMSTFDSSITESRDNPTTMDATEHWTGYTEMEHAFKNNFYMLINEDDPAVIAGDSGSGYKSDYKTNYDPWLYDRAATMYTLYMRSSSLKALREAVRNTDFYKTKIYPATTTPSRAIGLFTLKNPDPNGWPGGNGAMYSYDESMAYTYWLTGDNDMLTYIPLIVQAHETNDEPTRWDPSLGTWTERHTAFRLLANLIAYEVTGNTTYKTNVQNQTADFIWHQNGAGGLIPANRVDGGLYHYGSQHGDGVTSDLIASTWMSVLTEDAMIRAYAFTEDTNIANFVKRMGTFLNNASRSDAYHAYDTYVGALRYPDYMVKYDGTSDALDGGRGSSSNPTGGTTIEHDLEVGNAILWADYFNQLLGGSPNTTWESAVNDLYYGYDIGVNFWIRPTGPTAGKTAYRITPNRKWGWEFRTTGSFTWLASQLLTGSAPGDTTAPTVSITAPTSGQTVSGTITVSANASDNVGVAGVQFKVDGTNVGTEDTSSPYSISYNTSGLAAGSHTITAVARDAAGNTTTSSSVSVTKSAAADTTAPTVSITAPTSGQTVSGAITVSANASDNVGVAGVQFKVDGTNIGTEDTTSPYSISYNTTSLTNGSHSITAVARDAAGNTTTSSSVPVTISNSATGTVTFQQGVSSYTGAKDVSLTSQWSGNGGNIISGTLKVFDQTSQTTPYEIDSLLRFDNISIPAGKTVASAKLTLKMNTWASGFTMEGRYMQTDYDPTYSLIGWQNRKSGAQWATAGAKGNGTDYMSGKSFAISSFTATGDQVIDITLDPTVVQGWLTTPSTNQGVLLYIDNPTNIAVDIYSAEDATAANRPKLSITYQ
ncbi:Ig-like domain-containing protein [Paenibacillus sp. BC26]|uniref:Ig-like domain-containing protein n=1 Tax=Paenibacillus sp. BC26 TaxID=1881032 RepID=UPI0008E8F723|nr:Ig-like domain-containing protein [Paenibacillus sp. BC26]SFS67107.1 Ig-like domain (group 3) [Paenibacillus sp. BC26]